MTAALQTSLFGHAEFQNVLHPTDFDEGARPAFHHALKLALAAKGRLDVVHVERDRALTGREWTAFPAVRKTLGQWGLLDEDAPPSAVAEQLDLQVVKTDIAGSEPASVLDAYLQQRPIDLIVLGSHGREGLARIFHPSVSESLARRAALTALFVPQTAAGFVDGATGAVLLRNVLIPVDRSPDPNRAITKALALAQTLGVDPVIHLLHVGDPGHGPADGFEAHPRIRRLTRSGEIVRTIAGVADELQADLIVMATRGHDGFQDVLRGSTTEQVLRAARCPVLAVPA